MSKAEEAALEKFPVKIIKISYQDLINIFGGKGFVDSNSIPRLYFQQGYEQAEKDLGWISVKDRLPKIGHLVLTCVSYTGTLQYVKMALLLEDNIWWDGDTKVCVDYWMEIPKLKE